MPRREATTITIAGALLGITLASGQAGAGPYCGGGSGWSPGPSATLPLAAHVVFWQRDSTVLPTGRAYDIAHPKLTATIDGKPVAIRVHEARSRDVVLHHVEVVGKRSGTLVVTSDAGGPRASSATFTLDPDWHAPAAVATLSRYHEMSMRMAERFYDGLAIAVPGAIAFRVRWRRDPGDAWRTVVLPAVDRTDRDGSSAGHGPAALLGETDCQSADVPITLLEHGILLDVTATRVDGKDVHVDTLDGTVVLPAPAAPARGR